ncbi:hypothetical protein [Acetobacterium malicum]|uniref:hypothetical protein n=1 Tax=Acetobacterium malicum TaxID=52692 RepID=UPI000428EA66|nr:hypothetical protein [Acetobacterium dehalogenans]
MNKKLDLKSLLESKMSNIEPAENAKSAIERAEMKIPHNLMFDTESTEFKPETKPVTASVARGLTVEEAKAFDDEMNRFIDAVLVAGSDYFGIPHLGHPTLLKAGAEKILNYLGLIARTEVVNRIEDYNTGFFCYECKVFLIDYNGVVKGEGIGITNTRERKYAKSDGYSIQNVVLKMAKKRALVDAALNVGNLSARFTQDVEDMNIEPEHPVERNIEELRASAKPRRDKPATQKQIQYLETLMGQHNTSSEAMNKYVKEHYDVEDYKKITGVQASALIEKFKAIES